MNSRRYVEIPQKQAHMCSLCTESCNKVRDGNALQQGNRQGKCIIKRRQ